MVANKKTIKNIQKIKLGEKIYTKKVNQTQKNQNQRQ